MKFLNGSIVAVVIFTILVSLWTVSQQEPPYKKEFPPIQLIKIVDSK